MKKTVFILIFINSVIIAHAQSKFIEDVFRLLPADKVYGLTPGTRDSILNGKTYYPPDNDSNSIEAYNYGVSTEVVDFMYVSMSYETGQRGFGTIEIRRFKTAKGGNLVVVSKTAGVPVNYQHVSFSVFTFNNEKLVPYKKNIFPATDETLFMKAGIPDSIKKTILVNSNIAYNFSTATPTLGLNSPYLTNNASIRKWLKGDHAELAWTGDRFIINKIGFGH